MKKLLFLIGCLAFTSLLTAQVGIGTTAPNSKSVLELASSTKGFLLPRMTSGERTGMSLTTNDAGMIVYQTSSPRGVYAWDGTAWAYNAPMEGGTVNGNTLRWDGAKWASVSNLFNTGSQILIGNITSTTNQLHINANSAAYTRIQLTNTATGTQPSDGLLLGIGNTSNAGVAHILQLENNALTFGTNNAERIRIEADGAVTINSLSSPTGSLDVNCPFTLGAFGTQLQGIIRMDTIIDPPAMVPNAEWIAPVPCPNALMSGVVHVSPSSNMDHIMIAYARVSSVGNLEIKLINMSTQPSNDPGPITFRIAVIQ